MTWKTTPGWKTIARILSPKTRKSPLQADQVDQLGDYESFAIDTCIKALESIKLISTPGFPTLKSERDHYLPLCNFLNNCVVACHQSLGQLKGEYYDDLKFIVWDCEVKDGIAGAAALKPDFVLPSRGSYIISSAEPPLLRICGLFGALLFFLVCHGDDSPATNHLFLPRKPPEPLKDSAQIYHRSVKILVHP
jgi:hypothetical protein